MEKLKNIRCKLSKGSFVEMGIIEIFVIGISLAMDAFAVALCKGLTMKKLNIRHALIIALFFGGFQALMPFAGYLLGSSFERYIAAYDHWIAFGLLLVIGGKMIYDSLTDNKDDACDDSLNIKQLFVMAVATSIDALAVGVTFAFFDISVGLACTIIGVTTFGISVGGVVIGNRFGVRFKNKAQIAGGLVLVIIGTKILVEHLCA